MRDASEDFSRCYDPVRGCLWPVRTKFDVVNTTELREVDARSQRQDDIADAQKRSVAATVAELKEAKALEDARSALDRQRAQLANATTDLDAASQALRRARKQKDLATNAKVLDDLALRMRIR